MKTAFIFDMDGVLVDSEVFYFKVRMQFLREKNLPNYYPDINAYLGVDPQIEWQMMIPDPVTRQQLLPEFERFWKQHPIDYRQYLAPQAAELLQALKKVGFKVALASVGAPVEVGQMLERCQLAPYFDVILSGADVAHRKPAPDIYELAVKRLGLAKQVCVAIEDSPVGITAAKRAGLETWAVQDPRYHVDQSQADRIFMGIGALQADLQRQKLI